MPDFYRPRPLTQTLSPLGRGFQGGIKLYKLLISPLLPQSCRFEPTCSVYALQALEKHGVIRGGWLTVRRLLRCQPWSHRHGHDPVP